MRPCPYPDCGKPLEGIGTFCWSCERYPADYRAQSAPAEAPKRDDPRSEKEIQAATVGALDALGFGIWDTSQPFRAAITPGVADLFVAGRGVTAWIECKSATGRQSEAQAAFQKAVEANGGMYLIVRSESEVIAWAQTTPGGRPA